MKLRSGKVLISKTRSPLPPELDNILETKLQEFKILFSNDTQHAKELLYLISDAKSIDVRFSIRAKIEKYSNEAPGGNSDLMGVAGELAWLVVGNSRFYRDNNIEPEYHDLIQSRIENFDLETHLLGDMEGI